MQSHHKFNEHKTVEGIVNRIKAGETVALISDAGTPGISHTGFLIVRECVKSGIEVQMFAWSYCFCTCAGGVGIALMNVSALKDSCHKKRKSDPFDLFAERKRTMIFYESPYRLVKTLTQFAEFFGAERPVSVCREDFKNSRRKCLGHIN